MATSIEKKREAESERFKGNEYMKAKEYDEAIKCYGRAIEMNPSEAANYSNRAMAYLRMKVYPKVIADASKAIEIDPEYVKAYHRRGKAYLATNKFKEAISDFQFILEKNPNDMDINSSLREARQGLEGKDPSKIKKDSGASTGKEGVKEEAKKEESK